MQQMSEVKRPRGRPRNEEVKDTIASLAAQLRALEAKTEAQSVKSAADSKKIFDLLYELGEKSALHALGRDDE
jgi:hypothetical protein